MISHRSNPGRFRRLLLAGLIVLCLPAAAAAGDITVKNDLNVPVVVQGACVVKGMLQRDKPHVVKPGDSSPAISLPGDKVIFIYDAQNPNIVLGQVPVKDPPKDVTMAIVPIPKPKRNGPKVTLELVKPPPSP
jgi:hypothetical protein